jgi:hypothetical protein
LRSVPTHATWKKTESVDIATIWQLIARNLAAVFEKAMISVGHTNVKSRGYENRTTHFPLNCGSEMLANSVDGSRAWPLVARPKRRRCIAEERGSSFASEVSRAHIKEP